MKQVLSLLSKVTEKSTANQMTSLNLAKVFYPSMFPHKQMDFRNTDMNSLRDALPTASQGTMSSLSSIRSGQSLKSSQTSQGFSEMVKNSEGASSRDTLDSIPNGTIALKGSDEFFDYRAFEK